MPIETEIVIARPPAEVWDFIADARNDTEWCHKVESVEQVAGDGPGPDARYAVKHAPRPRRPPIDLAMDVVEFEPPRRLRWREEDSDGVYHVTYELEPAGEGTRLVQRDDVEWKLPRLLRPIGRMMVSRDIRRQFAQLKDRLERPAPS